MLAIEDVGVPCAIMRGGTSKGLFFLGSYVPADSQERTQFLLRAFGSPDLRQIDGFGGADLLTSRAAILGKSSQPGADVDYMFAPYHTLQGQRVGGEEIDVLARVMAMGKLHKAYAITLAVPTGAATRVPDRLSNRRPAKFHPRYASGILPVRYASE